MGEGEDSGAPWHVLATRAEIVRLAEHLTAVAEKTIDVAWLHRLPDEVRRRYRRAWRAGSEAAQGAMVFAVIAAGLLRDPSLAPTVLATAAPLLDRELGDAESVEEALGLLVERCDDLGPLAPLLHASARWAAVGLARGLRPERDDQREMLRSLARDPRVRVRNAAHERLRAVEEIPPWWGRWADDPAALVGAEVAAAHEAAIGAWVAQTASPYWNTDDSRAKGLEALAALPDALAVPATVTALRGFHHLDTRGPLMVALLAREGGAAVLVRETAAHVGKIHYSGRHLRELFAAVPVAQRDALVREAIGALAAMPEAAWRRYDGEASRVFGLLAGAWHEASDRGPVDASLARRFAEVAMYHGADELWPRLPVEETKDEPSPADEETAEATTEQPGETPVAKEDDEEEEEEEESATSWDETAPLFDLLPLEGVEAMLARGDALLDSGYDKPRQRAGAGEQYRRDKMEWSAGLSAAVFGLWAAAVLRDPEALPAVTDLCTTEDGRYERAPFVDALTAALGALVPLAEPTDGALDPVVEHHDPRIRYAVIAALDPTRAVDRAALEALAEDTTPWVADAAQERLTEVAEVAWWRGHFASDPTASMDADEARRLQPTFEALVPLMKDRAVRNAPEGRLGPLLAALPDDVVVALCEHQLRPGDRFVEGKWRGAMTFAAMGRAGAVAMFLRVAERWEAAEQALDLSGLKVAFQRGDTTFRRELCDAVLAYLGPRRGAPWTEMSDRAYGLVEWLAACWDPAWDVAPLFELLVRQATAEPDYPIHGVLMQTVVAADEGATEFVAPAARALEEGCTGRWTRLRGLAEEFVRRLPWDEQRALAERVLLAEGEGVTWALGELLGPLFDEERDGPHGERVAALLAEPKWRAVIAGSKEVRSLALGVLRAELRAGTLDVETASDVLADITKRFGKEAEEGESGDEESGDEEGGDEEGGDEEGGDEENDGTGEPDVHALPEIEDGPDDAAPALPAALSGPITDEEWTIWRGVRDRALAGSTELELAPLALFPPGPLAAADEPLLEYALGRVRADPRLFDQITLVGTLAAHPCERALAVVDEIIAVTGEPFADDCARGVRRVICAALGRDPGENEPPPRDFDDEDDDDDREDDDE